MRITFLMSCLEPGRDGVGDYCRRLGAEMEKLGHKILLISLNDHWCQENTVNVMECGSVLRLSSSDARMSRLQAAQDAVRNFGPDWMSLQYVCYGYHRKGLAWQWNPVFARLGNLVRHRHLMFHELWIEPPPFHRRFVGWVQRWGIRDLQRRFRPKVVTTSMALYQRRLLAAGIKAEVLPLFGNIAIAPRDDDHVRKLLQDAGSRLVQKPRADFVNGIIFGTVHPDFDIAPLSRTLERLRGQTARPILVSMIGRNGTASGYLAQEIMKTIPDGIEILALGENSANTISQALQYADFGISTNSPKMREKSGTLAAMREHGLPVILADGQLDADVSPSPLAQFSQFPTPDVGDAVTTYARARTLKARASNTAADLLGLFENAMVGPARCS